MKFLYLNKKTFTAFDVELEVEHDKTLSKVIDRASLVFFRDLYTLEENLRTLESLEDSVHRELDVAFATIDLIEWGRDVLFAFTDERPHYVDIITNELNILLAKGINGNVFSSYDSESIKINFIGHKAIKNRLISIDSHTNYRYVPNEEIVVNVDNI